MPLPNARTNARRPLGINGAAVPTGSYPDMARASCCEPQRTTERTSMKSMRSLAFGLLAAVAVVISSVSSAWHHTADAILVGVHRLKVWAFEALDVKANAAESTAEAVPLVQRVRHFAYQLRQVKRARPVVTPRWRMCPSG